MTLFPKHLRVGVLSLVLAAVLGTTSTLAHDIVEAGGSDNLSATAQQQLAQARQATAHYHDLDKAIADGFELVENSVPGILLVNPARLSTGFVITEPEVLIYTDDTGGVRKLVAIGYLIFALAPPEGFDGDQDVWQKLGHSGLWFLNAWIWLDNPDGIFNETNSKIP